MSDTIIRDQDDGPPTSEDHERYYQSIDSEHQGSNSIRRHYSDRNIRNRNTEQKLNMSLSQDMHGESDIENKKISNNYRVSTFLYNVCHPFQSCFCSGFFLS